VARVFNSHVVILLSDLSEVRRLVRTLLLVRTRARSCVNMPMIMRRYTDPFIMNVVIMLWIL